MKKCITLIAGIVALLSFNNVAAGVGYAQHGIADTNYATNLTYNESTQQNVTLSVPVTIEDEDFGNLLGSTNVQYTCSLEGNKEASADPSGYKVTLALKTKSSDGSGLPTGYKCLYTFKRTINGVTETLAKDVTDAVYVDTSLPETTDATGYYVTYSGTCTIIKNNGSSFPVASMNSNEIAYYIPGEENFVLDFSGTFKSEYDNTGAFGDNKNKFTNTLSGTVSGDITPFTEGNIISFVRNCNGTSIAVQSLTIDKVDQTGYTYTKKTLKPDGSYYISGGKEKTEAGIFNIAANCKDEFSNTAGTPADVSYQLIVSTGGSAYFSNKLVMPFYSTKVSVKPVRRSGSPESASISQVETYYNSVSFDKLDIDEVKGYYIWRNNSRVAEIVKSTDGNSYAIYTKDASGVFNVYAGQATVSGNKITCPDYVDDVAVNATEPNTAATNPMKFAYTVEIETTNGNTYGNNDVRSTFKGMHKELGVIITKMDGFRNENNLDQYRAELEWKSQLPTNEQTNIIGYDVYYHSFNSTDSAYVKLNTEIIPRDSTSYKTPIFNFPDYTSTNFPVQFYVKAIVDPTFLSSNVGFSLYNSNPSSSDFVTTGVNTAIVEGVKVFGESQCIHIQGANGCEVDAYNVSGQNVNHVIISNDDEIISLPSGLYLIRVDNAKTYKVLVR